MQAAAKHFATLGRAAAPGNVEMSVLLGHLTDELQLRCRAALFPVGVEHLHFGYWITIDSGTVEIASPVMTQRALPESVLVLRQREP